MRKSANEISAINHAVSEKLKEYMDKDVLRENIFETGLEIVKGIKNIVQKGKVQKASTANFGDGIIESNIVEYDMQPIDYKNSAEALDKAAVTLEVAQRHANTNLSVQNNIQTNNTSIDTTKLSTEAMKEILAARVKSE